MPHTPIHDRAAGPSLAFMTNVMPDVFDNRDLEYRPRLQPLPHALDERPSQHFVLTQQGSSCTGHAVASMVNTVLATGPNPIRVSPYMIYSLARRYDEFPGNADEGSSLRGALKGWYYHGVLPEEDWPSLQSDPQIDLDPDLALKALRHPLGAFYRVNAFRLDDVQSAVNELHAVVASARIHSGWIEPQAELREDDGTTQYIIRRSRAVDQLGGHAFAIVGYNDIGFLVQNSWGPAWGRKGFATLTYEDWLVSAYDAWVARPGVPSAVNLRNDTKVVTATNGGMAQGPGPDLERLKNHVVNLGNNGQLSGTGRFVSTLGQINKMFENMQASHRGWASQNDASNHAQPHRIVLYAHGGLVDENAGLRTAQAQLNWWLNNEVYPITFAWQSGPIETFISQLEDITKDLIPFGGLGFDQVEQADRLVEKVARSRLRWMWDEMKENAERSSKALPQQVSWPTPPAEQEQAPGASLLVSRLLTYVDEVAPEEVEVHLVGHSAGAIFTAHLLSRLAAEEIPVTSLSWLAPAITVDAFERLVVPLLNSRKLERFTSFGLSEALELDDVVGTDRLKIYQKSLLYLVSRALEGNGETPLVGLQRHMSDSISKQMLSTRATNFFWSPSQSPLGGRSSATSHRGMDQDMLTMTSVILQILGTTDLTPTTTFRSFTTLDAHLPGSSGKVSPAEAETVIVQPAGEVPVTHMGQPQDAHDNSAEKHND